MNNIDHLVEQYVLGNLSLEEAKSFEEYLSNTPAAKEKVDLQRDIIEAIKQKSRLEMKARLSQINPNASSTLTQKIAIAAATLVTATLVGIGMYSSAVTPQPLAIKTTTEVISPTPMEAQKNVSTSKAPKPTFEKNEATTPLAPTVITKNKVEIVTKSKISTPKTQNNETTKDNVAIVNKVKANPFEPINLSLDDSDEKSFGSNDDLVTEPNAQTKINAINKPYIIDSEEQGYNYNGKSMGISGEYTTAYTTYKVSDELGSLVFKYENTFYYIIQSDKLEKWEDHKITDPAILNELKKLK